MDSILAVITSSEAKFPKGTVVEIVKYFDWCDEYYVRAVDSALEYSVKSDHLRLCKEDSDDNS